MREGCGGTQVALTMFAAGLACIYIVWDCDRQRQMFRNSHGKCRIWGKVPSKVSHIKCVKILQVVMFAIVFVRRPKLLKLTNI